MPQNRNTSISHWTYKHDEYCLKNSLPPAAKLLWQWLLKKGINTEVEPDLKEFNKWVAKHRSSGAYCRNTLKDAFNKLVECRAINLVRKYTWNIVKIVTRPIEYLKPKKKLRKRNIFDTLDASKPQSSDHVSYQQQQLRITENKLTFSRYGIHFDDDELEVLDRPRNEVMLAIVCYQMADEGRVTQSNQIKVFRGKVKNPEGWIRTCLRKRYWDKPRTYEQIFYKYGNSDFIDELFPDTQ
ncbi:MAG: hypothetical protein HC836_19585 [Richelia sp. RM2_1_2]|nr:hypothetical protein [Richelia sp. RM1_1_1]NJO60387.1 hypothetical protein [Richelia sp. RM2_1_2]